MKKILFLLLFPSLALAQYQGNANQKITLGEQTTADGLVFRGVLNDTALITPLSDTSAYIILDTVNNKFYNYNRATNVWSVAGGGTAVTSITGGTGLTGGTITSTGTLAADTSFLFTQSDTLSLNLTNRFAAKLNIADTATMLTNYYLSGRALGTPTSGTLTNATGLPLTTGVTGTLPVANGGTGATSLSPNNYLIRTNSSGIFDTAAIFEAGGNVGIGTTSPTEKLHVVGKGLFTGDVNLIPTSGYTIFTQQSPNVSHGITSWLPNNAYSSATIEDTNNGGFSFVSATDAATPGALNFYGIMGSTTPTSNAIQFRAAKKNGTSIQSLGAAENAIIFQNYAGTDLLQFKGNGDAAFGKFIGGGTTGLSIDNTGTLVRTSSFELKKDIIPINYGLNEILQLNPINFNWVNSDKYGDNNENGFIAEDVMSIIPNSVNADSESFYMDYSKLIPILTKAIQEQQALIKALEQRILILENK